MAVIGVSKIMHALRNLHVINTMVKDAIFVTHMEEDHADIVQQPDDVK